MEQEQQPAIVTELPKKRENDGLLELEEEQQRLLKKGI